MYSQVWMVIKDETKRTFEVCGQTGNDNHFTNATHAMQKAGMNISSSTPNVTNKTASKNSIKFAGYTYEEGLQKRLQEEYAKIRNAAIEDW